MGISVGSKAAVSTKGLTVDAAASNKNPLADTALAIQDAQVQNKGKTATVVDKEVAVVVKAVQKAAEHVKVEVVGHARLWYNGILYEAGVVYEHTKDYADHLLSLIGIKNLPLFKVHAIAKPRPTTPTGARIVNLAAVKTKTSNAVPEPAVPGDEQAAHAGAKSSAIDLGEEEELDPELAAHLAAAGAGEATDHQQQEEPGVTL